MKFRKQNKTKWTQLYKCIHCAFSLIWVVISLLDLDHSRALNTWALTMDDFERRRELRRQKREEMRLEAERWGCMENGVGDLPFISSGFEDFSFKFKSLLQLTEESLLKIYAIKYLCLISWEKLDISGICCLYPLGHYKLASSYFAEWMNVNSEGELW